jgi:hypothetical protein
MPSLLAVASDKRDTLAYGNGVQPILFANPATVIQRDKGISTEQYDHTFSFLGVTNFGGVLNYTQRLLLINSPNYVSSVILKGRNFSGFESGDLGVVNRTLTGVFYGEGVANGGILAATIRNFSEKNPISAMITFGRGCIDGGLVFLTGSVAGGLISNIPGFGALNEIVNNPVFNIALVLLFTIGLILTFLVPLYPLFIWLKAVFGWFALVVEAIFAGPFWAFAHVLPEGQGFAGQHARKGYIQLLDITIRPVLLTAFACVAYVLMGVIASVISTIFQLWANAIGGYEEMTFVWQLVTSIAYVGLIYTGYHFLFSHLLAKSPAAIISWIGGIGMSISGTEQSVQHDSRIVAAGVTTGARGAGTIGSAIARGVGAKNSNTNTYQTKNTVIPQIAAKTSYTAKGSGMSEGQAEGIKANQTKNTVPQIATKTSPSVKGSGTRGGTGGAKAESEGVKTSTNQTRNTIIPQIAAKTNPTANGSGTQGGSGGAKAEGIGIKTNANQTKNTIPQIASKPDTTN